MRKEWHAECLGSDPIWSNLAWAFVMRAQRRQVKSLSLNQPKACSEVKNAFDNHNSIHWCGILHFYWVHLPAGIGKLFSCIQVAWETYSFRMLVKPVTVKMGKTRYRTVRDIYVTDPWQISVRKDRLQRAIIPDGWRLIFSLKTKGFAKIRDGLAIIRNWWRLIFSLKT